MAFNYPYSFGVHERFTRSKSTTSASFGPILLSDLFFRIFEISSFGFRRRSRIERALSFVDFVLNAIEIFSGICGPLVDRMEIFQLLYVSWVGEITACVVSVDL